MEDQFFFWWVIVKKREIVKIKNAAKLILLLEIDQWSMIYRFIGLFHGAYVKM